MLHTGLRHQNVLEVRKKLVKNCDCRLKRYSSPKNFAIIWSLGNPI